MQISNAMYRYLQAIFYLQQKQSMVRNIDLALYLGYSRASVTKAIQVLVKKGLVEKKQESVYLSDSANQYVLDLQVRYTKIVTELKQHAFSEYDAVTYANELLFVMDDTFFKYMHWSLGDNDYERLDQ